jgi:signal transduction histidine kinase
MKGYGVAGMEKRNSILIVDDDTSNLMELSHILMPEYKISAAKSGETALEAARESLPDLILLDVIMPGMNGFEVIAELKKTDATKNIPVIFITGINASDNESEGLSIGAVDYIRKPFDVMVVKHRVRLQIEIINLRNDLEAAVKSAQAAAEAAKAANRSKSSFLASMSHEIRTPMNVIMGVTDILMHEEALSDKIADGLDKIYASSDMLLGIINDILDFSKIEAGKLDIIPAKYCVASIINDSIHLNMMRIGDKPIELELSINENMPANFIGDELRIKQILNNLLSNAFKYTNAGKVTLTVTYEAKDDIDHLILIVKDTGQGMSREQLSTVFEEYSRFNEKVNRAVEGTGLGLTITQRLIDRMNGEINVESEPGQGTLITVRLPQEIADGCVMGREAAENLCEFRRSFLSRRKDSEILRDPMPYGRVLVVDDTETNLFVAVGLMKLYKLRCDTAMNGREAIEKVKNGNVYDVIFMDHMMPEMDGMEAAKQLRALGYTSPIVALTANAVTGQKDTFLANGFDDFISKPIDIRQLDTILNHLVRDKQPPEVIEAARRQTNGTEGENGSKRTQEDLMLLGSFIRDARKVIVLIERLCDDPGLLGSEKELRAFTVVIHGIKSSLGLIGEKDMSEEAYSLERAGRDQNIGFIELTLPGFLSKMRGLLDKLEVTNDEESGDIEGLSEKLLSVKELCEDYDRKGAFDVLAGIKCPKEARDVIGKITEHILHSNFDEAAEMAAEYARELEGGSPAYAVRKDIDR